MIRWFPGTSPQETLECTLDRQGPRERQWGPGLSWDVPMIMAWLGHAGQRQAETWDPSCSACSWTSISWSNKIQRNYKALKITMCTHSWGEFWTVRHKKTQKLPLPLLKGLRQKQGVGSKSRLLCMSPALNTNKAVGDHLCHLSGLTPIRTPTLAPHKESACPTSWSKQVREPVTWSHSPLLQQGPQ